MMYFTHLIDNDSGEPSQEMLQRYTHYLVIVVLDDAMGSWVRDQSGLEMASSASALCWVITPKHFRTAPAGSVLRRILEALEQNGLFSLDNSFLAMVKRDDLLKNPDAPGSYSGLYLGAETDEKGRRERLREAVNASLRSAEKKPRAATVLATTAAVLVRAVFAAYSRGVRLP